MKIPLNPMRRGFLLCAAVLLAAVTTLRAAAADATGSVTGRVINTLTGVYLHNARVTIQGTDMSDFTDETGTYRLVRVPAGRVVLEVYYTGLDPQRIGVDVVAGGMAERDVSLTSVARYGEAADAVKLDAFVVSSSRETDGESIAINEQRFAPNIKTVIAADSLGDMMDGNVGEFLKYLPGLTAEYDTESGGSVASVAVRGFPSAMAVLSSDGMQMANTGNPQGSSRVFQFKEVSINNVSRIEVTKIPTPSTPADSMAGSIDMVSKSAFERRNAQLQYSVGLAGIHNHLSLDREPHVSDRRIYKIRPSTNFDYTLPVTRTFGIVVTGQYQGRFVEQTRVQRGYANSGTGSGASLERPFMSNYTQASVPRITERMSLGLRVDWRATPGGVFSLNVERSRFVADRSNASISFSTGTNGNPTVAGGVPLSYGEDFTQGAAGRGGVSLMGTGASVVQRLDARSFSLRYRFDNGTWRILAGFAASESKGGYYDTGEGRFRTLGIQMIAPVRVSFSEINQVRPGVIRVFDNANREVDWYDPNNYRLNTAQSTPRPISDTLTNAKLDVRRTLGFLAFPASVQAGGLNRVQVRDVRRQSIDWTYNGPDGNPATPDSPAPFRMENYVDQKENYGFRGLPYVSLYKAWEAFKANPSLFSKTLAQQVSEEQFRINQSERLEEAIEAAYLQVDAGLFRNRLRILTGVRYERTSLDGLGPLYDPNAIYQRNPDGSFVHDARGSRVRLKEAGAAGSLEELRMMRRERAYRAERSYDGFYPSAHLTWTVRENLLARLAFARTYGRPDFANIIPNTTINETDFIEGVTDPNAIPGRLNVRNTGIRPWTADNFDLSLEYYTPQGGMFSAGAFRKDIRDFFGDVVKIATEEDLRALGLEPDYAGWQLSTRYNMPDEVRVTGVEFSVRHSLRPLGAWVRDFQAFVNGTKLRMSGDRDTDFSAFVPESLNWGLTYSRKPLHAMLKWNYRGEQRRGRQTAFGPDGYEYIKERTMLDVNLTLHLWRSLFLYLNGQNVMNVPETLLRRGSSTPEYARKFQNMTHGVQLTLGIRGTF